MNLTGGYVETPRSTKAALSDTRLPVTTLQLLPFVLYWFEEKKIQFDARQKKLLYCMWLFDGPASNSIHTFSHDVLIWTYKKPAASLLLQLTGRRLISGTHWSNPTTSFPFPIVEHCARVEFYYIHCWHNCLKYIAFRVLFHTMISNRFISVPWPENRPCSWSSNNNVVLSTTRQ